MPQLPNSHDHQSNLVVSRAIRGYCIRALEYLPDGRVVVGASDATVKIWNIRHRKLEGRVWMAHDAEVHNLVVMQNGTKIISSDVGGVVNVWDIGSHALIKHWIQPHRAISLSPNNRHLALGRSAVLVYATEGEWQVSQTIEVNDEVLCMTFSPGSDKLACGTMNDIRIYDLSNGSFVLGVASGQQRIRSLLWSPCSFKLFSCSDDSTISWWDYETPGKLIGQPWASHSGTIRSLHISPGGDIIASLSNDNIIRLWDRLTASLLGKPLICVAFVHVIRFSPSGELLGSAEEVGDLYM